MNGTTNARIVALSSDVNINNPLYVLGQLEYNLSKLYADQEILKELEAICLAFVMRNVKEDITNDYTSMILTLQVPSTMFHVYGFISMELFKIKMMLGTANVDLSVFLGLAATCNKASRTLVGKTLILNGNIKL